MNTFCPVWFLNTYGINVKCLCMPYNAFHALALIYFSSFIFLVPILQVCLIISPICPAVLCPCMCSLEQKPPFTSLGLGLQVPKHVSPLPLKSSLITLQKQTRSLSLISWTLNTSFLSSKHQSTVA